MKPGFLFRIQVSKYLLLRRFYAMKMLLTTAAVLLLTTAISWNAMAAEVTLKSIMQDLGVQMGRLAQAIMADDMETASAAAGAIAHHPKPGWGERLVILGQLGSDAPAFRDKDLAVHEEAMGIQQAAEAGDRDALALGFQRLTSACLACHSSFRDQVRSADRADEGRP
jgi:cytochrome c556